MKPNQRTQPIKVGVIGVGSMGQHHARVYSELPETELVAIVDINNKQARLVAEQYRTTVMDREQLLNQIEAVSIAVPTRSHYQLANDCIEHGVDVLIEKPLVMDPEKGAQLIRHADANSVTIQVGHVEQFNPVMDALSNLLPGLSVISLRAQRLGPPVERIIQDSVVFDLMIHDIDIVTSLLGEEPTAVNAVGTRENDHVTANLQFPSSTVGTLIASRATQREVRTLEITTKDRLVSADFVDRTLKVYRGSLPESVHRYSDEQYQGQQIIEQLTVTNEEPLQRELRSFIEVVASDGTPHVSATQALQAVKLARRIDEQAKATTEASSH